VPLESAELIAVKSSNLKRDYSIKLVPEEDPRMIVWELQRPIQQTLPPLSDEWEQEFHRCWRINDINSSTNNVLHTAKDFCIKALLSALKKDCSQASNDDTVLLSFGSISKWLETQSPCQVVFIYKDLQDQLADRNGLMVSTNTTAHILTGSSNNAVLLGNVLQGKAFFFMF
jgi:hypothetical protein